MSGPVDRSQFDRISEDDAFEASEVFLACMFADNQVLAECGLEWEDFGEELHQLMFKEGMELFRSGQPVTAISLKPFMPKAWSNSRSSRTRRDDDEAGILPATYMARLMSLGFDPSTMRRLESSLHIIKSVSLGRQLAREAEIASELAKEGHTLLTLDDEIEQLEMRLTERRTRLAALRASASPGSSYLAMFEASARRDGVVGVPIALPEIAKVLSEPVFEAGNLYGLLSSSGEGKSSLTMQLIYHAVRGGHPVLFLSYDQSAAQCIRQMIAQVHEISVRQQREPSRLMTESERDRCVLFATQINNQPFDIIRCQREGVMQLVAYARRFIKKRANGKTPFIVIDHIGKVKPRDPKLSADRISGEVTVELKALADELSASVLILNQRNGESGKRQNPRPIAKDLYGGEGARADYDAIITLYRPEKYKKEMEKVAATPSDWKTINSVFGSEIEGIAEIASIKVRFGDPSIVEKLQFDADFTRYRSMKLQRPQEELAL
ncbi:DnaB-like helicase C-terminal domain-containing protein [Rhizobium halophilum]|uniref:DnaB-like helicase C-terminal domain-containing protein n=1 Tax=Rhizobium halophilum TaxID=2846852 RepID=UPI001EFDA0B5|nr:DnaB-like helicase C-terminal domain-containing protein [Rhizobium halophilum]MCF6371083.1 helicase DnaB [Rhizobium halophilum]